ncbi:hypothetical protein [Candidatus Borrarchaeum sp.]|uniref:hypothetical protein n=1 Tax=Candidatus Borrarchaeum sp. TaxID=2846742 RepID=UPI00257C87A2|nr:hypothetical protein [Candidatus Borrarchaeum sp.]
MLEHTEQIRIPTEIVQEIMFQSNYAQCTPELISEHLSKEGLSYSKEDVENVIDYYKTVSKDERECYRLEQYAKKRIREIDRIGRDSVPIYLSKEEKETIRRASELSGKVFSQFIRFHMIRISEQILNGGTLCNHKDSSGK